MTREAWLVERQLMDRAVAITSKAITLPILEIVQSGKLTSLVIGEGMATDQGVYQLIGIGCPGLRGGDEIGISFKWKRLGDLP